MTPASLKLHMSIYRHLCGAVGAYKTWIEANEPPAEINPDPIAHFKEKAKEIKQQQAK